MYIVCSVYLRRFDKFERPRECNVREIIERRGKVSLTLTYKIKRRDCLNIKSTLMGNLLSVNPCFAIVFCVLRRNLD